MLYVRYKFRPVDSISRSHLSKWFYFYPNPKRSFLDKTIHITIYNSKQNARDHSLYNDAVLIDFNVTGCISTSISNESSLLCTIFFIERHVEEPIPNHTNASVAQRMVERRTQQYLVRLPNPPSVGERRRRFANVNQSSVD